MFVLTVAVLVDPMCGSGTLLIEAALIATATAPGLLRDTRECQSSSHEYEHLLLQGIVMSSCCWSNGSWGLGGKGSECVAMNPKRLSCCPAAGANPWPFLHWPDYQQQQWKQLVQAAQQAAREGHKAWKAGGGRILGNDCHAVRAEAE
jgi:23S rRNA G2445 N2-methylase RlmL